MDYKRSKQLDGFFIGAKGESFPADTNISEIPRLKPDNGSLIEDSVVYINGILTDPDQLLVDMQALANSGCEVIAIHCATQGLRRDLVSCMWDTFKKGRCAAVETLREVVRRSLESGFPLHLVGHSRGALIISRVLREVTSELRAAGVAKESVASRLAKLKIETYGSGGAHFKNGPQYVHVENKYDPIPALFGTGKLAQVLLGHANYGEGAVVRRLSTLNTDVDLERIRTRFRRKEAAGVIDEAVHSPAKIYFADRLSFDQARNQADN